MSSAAVVGIVPTMSTAPTVHTANIDMRSVLRLAAAAECDPRTAERALREGAHVIRTRSVRDRLAAALAATAPSLTAHP